MSKRQRQRRLIGTILAGGLLFGGTCGITTLQLQDFITSTLIRTAVTTSAAVIESAIIAAEQQADVGATP
ncbi:MAG: hypothetical protein IIB57_03100 [Planctomycetes bacterium]|nr:hypothetical protein [Planctomycetota bacterium]